jgi:hypothetical protein
MRPDARTGFPRVRWDFGSRRRVRRHGRTSMVRKGSPVRVRQRASETALQRGFLVSGPGQTTTSTDKRTWSPVRARHGAVRQSPVRRRLSAGDAETTSSARRQPGTQWVPLRRGRPCLYDEWLVGHGYLSASPSLSSWQAQTTTQTRRSPRRWPSSKRPEPPRPSPNTTSRDLTGPRQLTTRSIHMMGQSDFHREGCDSPQMTPLTERSTSARVTWNALFGSSGKMLAISQTRWPGGQDKGPCDGTTGQSQ